VWRLAGVSHCLLVAVAVPASQLRHIKPQQNKLVREPTLTDKSRFVVTRAAAACLPFVEQEALNVTPGRRFESCSEAVGAALGPDVMRR
jgi:hypothetical protein